MKIPPTKYDVHPTKYDIPLPFIKRNSTRHPILSCEDPLFIKESIPKILDHPRERYIPPDIENVHSKRSTAKVIFF